MRDIYQKHFNLNYSVLNDSLSEALQVPENVKLQTLE